MKVAISKRFCAILAFLIAVSVLSSCGRSQQLVQGTKGGTLRILSSTSHINHLDPQRNYSREDLAFASGFLTRTLTQYRVTPDAAKAGELVADLGTDLGVHSQDAKSWTFTIRDGIKWQDGSVVTCADVKYGVSRSFATNVITGGPYYAVAMLDIPITKEGTSKYRGPYVKDAAGQRLFDKAVACDGNKITFNLANPSLDFNYIVSLSAFAPVPKARDKRAKYDFAVQSTGPYQIKSYVKKSKLVLVRNPNWDPLTDSIRSAFPDRIEYEFSVPRNVIATRLMKSAGADAYAVSAEPILSSKVGEIFSDQQFAKRRFNGPSGSVSYYAINTLKVPNELHRKAIQAAFPREGIRKNAGGLYSGDYADGLLSPSLAKDFASTNLWTGLLGEAIAPTGNPALAKQLITKSRVKFPNPLILDYVKSPAADRNVAAVVSTLAKAGIVVKPRGVSATGYYQNVLNLKIQGGITPFEWTADWPNASTVLPDLVGGGGFDLSHYTEKSWLETFANVAASSDRGDQAKGWKSLNSKAVDLGLVVPVTLNLQQRLVGAKVQGAYLWAAYDSWPYATLSTQ